MAGSSAEGASDTAVDFLCYYVNTENQRKGAAAGFWLPVAKGAGDAVEDTPQRLVGRTAGRKHRPHGV